MRLLLLTMIAVLLLLEPALAEVVSGKATTAGPGALDVGGKTIRLDDIRMPGKAAKCSEWRGQKQVPFSCGDHAEAALASLIADRTVVCAAEDGTGTCYVDGRDIAERLVTEGWASACGQTARYVSLETTARQARQGMWTGNFTLDTTCPSAQP